MPKIFMSEVPPPRSWDEFEEIVWDLLRREWNDPNTVRHARQGHGGSSLYLGENGQAHLGLEDRIDVVE